MPSGKPLEKFSLRQGNAKVNVTSTGDWQEIEHSLPSIRVAGGQLCGCRKEFSSQSRMCRRGRVKARPFCFRLQRLERGLDWPTAINRRARARVGSFSKPVKPNCNSAIHENTNPL